MYRGVTQARPSLKRSLSLFRAFRLEPTDPDHFYRLLAEDSVSQVSGYTSLSGKVLLDVGGGAGYFAQGFRKAGATYFGVDPDVGELGARGAVDPGMVRASGTALPFLTGCIDICYSSNVLEHVSEPETMLSEMTRVTKPGGLVYVSFTPWLSPWGGHETAPWHYFGGNYARQRYARTHGHEPKNVFGTSLFAVSVGRAIRWAQQSELVEVIQVLPRYHPWWAHWVMRVPGAREILAWNAVLVMRRKG